MFKKIILFLIALNITGVFAGCQTSQGNVGHIRTFSYPSEEPAWIREGNPIKFEGELWYPTDGIEVFKDSEMLMVGTYNGVQFFIERADVKPYARLYTKFDKNEFRYFEKRSK